MSIILTDPDNNLKTPKPFAEVARESFDTVFGEMRDRRYEHWWALHQSIDVALDEMRERQKWEAVARVDPDSLANRLLEKRGWSLTRIPEPEDALKELVDEAQDLGIYDE